MTAIVSSPGNGRAIDTVSGKSLKTVVVSQSEYNRDMGATLDKLKTFESLHVSQVAEEQKLLNSATEHRKLAAQAQKDETSLRKEAKGLKQEAADERALAANAGQMAAELRAQAAKAREEKEATAQKAAGLQASLEAKRQQAIHIVKAKNLGITFPQAQKIEFKAGLIDFNLQTVKESITREGMERIIAIAKADRSCKPGDFTPCKENRPEGISTFITAIPEMTVEKVSFICSLMPEEIKALAEKVTLSGGRIKVDLQHTPTRDAFNLALKNIKLV